MKHSFLTQMIQANMNIHFVFNFHFQLCYLFIHGNPNIILRKLVIVASTLNPLQKYSKKLIFKENNQDDQRPQKF